MAYAPLNVGGANDVATLKLDARPSGSTSSDGVASAKNSYRETSNPRCFHQAGNGGYEHDGTDRQVSNDHDPHEWT